MRNYQNQPTRQHEVLGFVFLAFAAIFMLGQWSDWVAESDEFRFRVLECMTDRSKAEYMRCSKLVSEQHEQGQAYAGR